MRFKAPTIGRVSKVFFVSSEGNKEGGVVIITL